MTQLMSSNPALTRRILRLTWPLALAGIATPALALVDTAVVGHLPEPHHLAAVAVGTSIFSYLSWLFAFLRAATTGITARADGRDDRDEVRAALARGLLVAVVLGVGLLVMALPLTWLAFHFFHVSPEVRAEARAYVLIRALGLPIALANLVIMGWLMGLQRPRRALAMELVRAGTVVVLDVGLVWGAGLAVRGVAMAALVADVIALGLGFALVARTLRLVPGKLTRARVFDREAMHALLRQNGDLFLRTLGLLVAFTGFTLLGARLGDTVVATNALLLNLFLFSSYALSAFGQTASMLTGAALGAGDPRALNAAARTTTRLAAIGALVSTMLLALAGPWLVDALTSVVPVRAAAREFLPYAVLLPLASFASYQLDGLAVGVGRTALVRNALVAAAVAFVLVGTLAPPLVGNHGVWLAFTAFMVVRSAGLAVSWRAIVER